jgi:peroxiredoxin
MDDAPQPLKPEDAVGREVPDITLPDADGRPWPLRSRVGQGPLVLFFYIHNGTPG